MIYLMSTLFTVGSDVNPCLANGGKGPCQQVCTYLEQGYHCSCLPEWQLSINQHSCFKPGQDDCVYGCSGNGVCLQGGHCDCQFGWRGPSCSEAVCYNFANCFGHGNCIAPNECDCLVGWGGSPALLISAPFIGRVRRVQNILVVVGAILPRNVRLAVDSVPTIRAQHRSVNLGCTIRALLLL